MPPPSVRKGLLEGNSLENLSAIHDKQPIRSVYTSVTTNKLEWCALAVTVTFVF